MKIFKILARICVFGMIAMISACSSDQEVEYPEGMTLQLRLKEAGNPAKTIDLRPEPNGSGFLLKGRSKTSCQNKFTYFKGQCGI